MLRSPSRFVSRLLPFLAVPLLFAGCNFWSGGSVETTYDGSFAYLSGSTPAAGSSTTAVSEPITVVFSEPIDNTSISTTGFVVTDDLGNVLSGELSQTAGANPTASFTPYMPMRFGATYTVALSGIRDAARRKVLTPAFAFTTGSEPLGAGVPFRISRYPVLQNKDYEPDIIADGAGNYAVTWRSSSVVTGQQTFGTGLRKVSHALGGLWGPGLIIPPAGADPRLLEMPGVDNQLLLMGTYDNLIARRVSDNGTALGPAETLYARAPSESHNPYGFARSRNGRYALLCRPGPYDNVTHDYSLFARIHGPAGWDTAPGFPLTGVYNSRFSGSINSSGMALVVYQSTAADLDAALFDPATGQWRAAGTGIAGGTLTESFSFGNSFFKTAAGDDGTAAAIWMAPNDNGTKVKYRIFSSATGWSGTTGLFIPPAGNNCSTPSIAAGPGGVFFASCWVGNDNVGLTPYAARYAPASGWSAWTPLGAGGGRLFSMMPIQIAVDGGGNGYFAWSIAVPDPADEIDSITSTRAAAWRAGTGPVDFGVLRSDTGSSESLDSFGLALNFSIAANDVGALVAFVEWRLDGGGEYDLWGAFLR